MYTSITSSLWLCLWWLFNADPWSIYLLKFEWFSGHQEFWNFDWVDVWTLHVPLEWETENAVLFIKGEVRSWSNLISEERVTFSEQNSENLMKISWKIRKLWHFEISQIFRKHFLTSPYECKWVSWWCHRLTIFHSFCTQKWQKFHISAMRMLDLPWLLSE